MNRQAYLDNNASTRVDPAAVEAMLPYFSQTYGNASSIHEHGQKARGGVENARTQTADLLRAAPDEIIFTCGGTEADNAAVFGVAESFGKPGSHLITSKIEHPAVLRACEALENRGHRVTYVDVDSDGVVILEQIEESISDETALVSVMYVNNEIGSIQPVGDISAIARRHGVLFHTDAVQAAGKIPVDLRQERIDLLSISAHKFHGPKGVGALFLRSGVKMAPFLVGGSHERKRRAGTENVPGIVGMGKACQLAAQHLEDFQTRIGALRDQLERGVLERIPGAVLNGQGAKRAPHVSNISFPGLRGEALLVALDFRGIAVSTGAACSSGAVSASHVLTAMGLDTPLIDSAIRFSLSRMTTEEDIEYVLEILPEVIGRMKETAIA